MTQGKTCKQNTLRLLIVNCCGKTKHLGKIKSQCTKAQQMTSQTIDLSSTKKKNIQRFIKI